MREEIGGFGSKIKAIALIGGAFVSIGACAFFGAQWWQSKRMQEEVSKHLKDPSSAEFRNLTRQGSAICGEVNAKNGFGGYAGFTAFILVEGQSLLLAPNTTKKSPSPEERLVELEENIAFLKAYTNNCPTDKE